jgi:hypothetical protein
MPLRNGPSGIFKSGLTDPCCTVPLRAVRPAEGPAIFAGCPYRDPAAGCSSRMSLPGSRRRPFVPDVLTGIPPQAVRPGCPYRDPAAGCSSRTSLPGSRRRYRDPLRGALGETVFYRAIWAGRPRRKVNQRLRLSPIILAHLGTPSTLAAALASRVSRRAPSRGHPWPPVTCSAPQAVSPGGPPALAARTECGEDIGTMPYGEQRVARQCGSSGHADSS